VGVGVKSAHILCLEDTGRYGDLWILLLDKRPKAIYRNLYVTGVTRFRRRIMDREKRAVVGHQATLKEDQKVKANDNVDFPAWMIQGFGSGVQAFA